MVSMAQALRKIPTENITFVQYPNRYGTAEPFLGKVQPLTREATALFDRIRADERFALEEGNTGVGSTLDPNAPVAAPTPEPEPEVPAKFGKVEPEPEPEPTLPPIEAAPVEVLDGVQGQTAAEYTCSVSN
jgi:hypothetical protein